MQWKHFRFREIKDALAWAAEGNIAVHDTGLSYGKYKHTCHMFAKDEASLRTAAKMVGCRSGWYQKRPSKLGFTDHYDLFGTPLKRAFALCINYKEN